MLTTLIALALAQTTTTVTTDQQKPPPPPPSTQVVANPNENPPPPPRTQVRVDEPTSVETVPSGRSAAAIVATDALYGGIAGTLIGGGITLIDQGNHWERDLMMGAGIGILVGAGFGVYEAATQPAPRVVRAAADPNPAASNASGLTLVAAGGRF